jgi:hypothetical protein
MPGCTHAHADIRDKIRSYAQEQGLDPDWVEALAVAQGADKESFTKDKIDGVEYRWMTVVTSPLSGEVWAHGPMAVRPDQIKLAGKGWIFKTDSQGREYSPDVAANPEVGVEVAIDYLKAMQDKCQGEGGLSDDQLKECAVAKYKGGPNTKRDRQGKYETQAFVNYVGFHQKACTGKNFTDAPAVRAVKAAPTADDKKPGGGSGGSVICKTADTCEPILPFPVPPSPYFASFQIAIIGGKKVRADEVADPNFTGPPQQELPGSSFILTPERPQYVTYFELSEIEGRPQCDVRVFDPNWDRSQQVSDVVSEQQKNGSTYIPSTEHEVLVSFGYSGEDAPIYFGNESQRSNIPPPRLWSEQYHMELYSFQPEYLGFGVEMQFQFLGKGYASNSDTSVTKTYQAPIADPADTETRPDGTEGPGTKTIVGQLCKDHDMDMCVMPTEPLLAEGAGLKKAAPSHRSFLRDAKGVMTFVKDDLVPMSALKGERDSESGVLARGNFNLWMEENSPDTRPMLHLHEPFWDGEIKREYLYARQQFGAIIKFKPTIIEGAMKAVGSSFTEARSFSVVEKQFYEKEYNLDKVKNAALFSSGSVVDRSKIRTDKQAVAIRKAYPSVTIDPAITEVEALNFWSKAYHFTNDAELQIIGDPLIKPNTPVRVTVLQFVETETGEIKPAISFVSGNWNVQGIRHIIQAGEFLTILQLIRTDPLGGVTDASIDGVTTPEGAVDTSDSAFFNNFENNINP